MVGREAIERAVDLRSLIGEVERAFVDYSAGRAVVPPVGHLGFADPPGDLHLKYGYIKGAETAVVKLATGFPENARRGLPTGDGLMVVLDATTGLVRAVLLDSGYLTDLRTAVAGAVAAKHLGPRAVHRIGIMGTGVQARLQLTLLRQVTTCRQVTVWGRSVERARALAADLAEEGWEGVAVAPSADALAEACDLIVTTTTAREPLFRADAVRPGTHITAMGADAPGKQELDPALFSRADVVVADSIAQCADHGDLAHALAAGTIDRARVRELGAVVADPALGRTGAEQITIADLTGVAVQDIVIATHVWGRVRSGLTMTAAERSMRSI